MWEVLLWFQRLLGIGRVRNGAIITDCCDTSARGRLLTRWRALFGWTPTFVDITAETAELERGSAQALVHLLNQIDASRSPEPMAWWRRWWRGTTVILVNSATRGKKAVSRPNGSPFCYWWADNETLVVATLDGPVLPLASHYGVIPDGVVYETDLDAVMDEAVVHGWISRREADRIRTTQFRSLEYQPLLAKWVAHGRRVPTKKVTVPPLVREHVEVLYVDNFGNCTLSMTAEEFGFEAGLTVRLANGVEARCIPHLTDVKNGHTAITIGSDGYRDPETGAETRLLELVVMRGSASTIYNLRPGSEVVLTSHIPAHIERQSVDA